MKCFSFLVYLQFLVWKAAESPWPQFSPSQFSGKTNEISLLLLPSPYIPASWWDFSPEAEHKHWLLTLFQFHSAFYIYWCAHGHIKCKLLPYLKIVETLFKSTQIKLWFLWNQNQRLRNKNIHQTRRYGKEAKWKVRFDHKSIKQFL